MYALKMLTEKQQAWRATKITASRVPTIILRPYDAWLEMTGRVERPEPGDAAILGNLLEPAVLAAAEHFGGFKIARRNIMRAAPNGVMGATLDAMTDASDIVEAKTTAVFNSFTRTSDWGEPGTDEVPERVLLQVVAQQVCTPEAARTHVAAMIGRGFNMYVVARDADLCGMVEEKVLKFKRDHLDTDKPPAIDAGPISDDYIKAVSRTAGPVAQIPDGLLERFAAAKENRKTAEEVESVLSSQIMAALNIDGSYVEEGADSTGNRVTYKQTKSGHKFDEKSFAQSHPDLFAKFQVVRPGYRRMLVKTTKGESA